MAAVRRIAAACLQPQQANVALEHRGDAVMTRAFITFHPADREHAARFAEQFSDVVTTDLGGVNNHDDFIKNTNEATYIQRQIREKYLANTTVTIMLAGNCTWSQRFVDWEIAASLRQDAVRGRSALLGISLPHLGSGPTIVPERFQDNLSIGYAVFKPYPSTSDELRGWILEALEHRDTITPNNSRPFLLKDGKCKG
jgi:hypothetical protein